MDSFDAHLTWFGHAYEDVPMLPAVYSGYMVYFSCVSGKRRYIVLVNISGDTQIFTYGMGVAQKTVTLPPRSVSSEILSRTSMPK